MLTAKKAGAERSADRLTLFDPERVATLSGKDVAAGVRSLLKCPNALWHGDVEPTFSRRHRFLV